ncbi:hypothetical protein HDG34_003302 [Paraburkholderia sp. HC6.4b]|uniref:hypothetical protein n=1 Tax=unclassified Paraburkholderia TaxID=2615204 RepID=UPI001622C653|nr:MULTISPECIES: hypothetical protein [unclassified Paraburkholderia]MBB5409361.1 hypothetical protein [Paraburkholderia sp. HC6.4b]MBB5451089.1 hypothetical protein [Paraburkholderia sp. Kb1A]
MSVYETLCRDQGQNRAEFDLLEAQLVELLEKSGEGGRIPEGIRDLRHVATLRPGDTESRCVAAQQCARVVWWLARAFWTAEVACSLIYGIDPPVDAADDAAPVECHALDGRLLTGNSAEVYDAWVLLQSLLAWVDRQVEQAEATPETPACEVSPAEFINWCQDEGIDTSYLRLIRTLIGVGNGSLVGRLPLADVQIFKPGKQ